jgi:hypothetical protein
MKYTQRQWNREIGWGEVPKEYAHETKLEEYKSKINYDVWTDVSNVKYNMKVNYNVQTQDSESTRSKNRNDKS